MPILPGGKRRHPSARRDDRPHLEPLEPRLLLTQVAFSPTPLDFPAGDHPYGIVAADLDGDGRSDLALTCTAGVSVLLNKGNGVFAPKVDYPTGPTAGQLTAADFNGDGRLDLAAVNGQDQVVSVLLNIGNGVFASRVTYSIGANTKSITAADFNGDGHPDLAVPYGLGDSTAVLFNNGNGTFAPATCFAASGRFITSADFNHDGYADLAMTRTIGSGNYVTVRLNDGLGGFAATADYVVGWYSTYVTAADLNGDGESDLAVINENDRTVSVLMNKGDGTFAARADFAVGKQPTSVTAADFNGDGHLDLAVTNYASLAVNVLLNDGLGGFSDRTDLDAPYSWGAAAADLNGDGRMDLAMGYYSAVSSNSVKVLLGNGDGTLVTGSSYSAGSIVSTADLNGDGRPDLVTKTARSAAVLLNLGNGAFAARADYGFYNDLSISTIDLAVADFNGDGRPDLAVTGDDSSNRGLRIMLNNGNGTFSQGSRYSTTHDLYRPIAADLNGDGRPDLAMTRYGSSANLVSVMLNNGDGTFGPLADYTAGIGISSLAAADLNADGKPDLVLVRWISVPSHGGAVSVLLNDGDGTFGAVTDYDTGPGFPRASTIADFNHDGKPDLAILVADGNTVGVWLNNGNGAFAPRIDRGIGLNSAALAAADLNDDGRPDLITGGDTLAVLLNNGDGTSFGRTDYAVAADSLAVADLDGDGSLDVAAKLNGAGNFSVLLNNGGGALAAPAGFAFGSGGLTAADFNGDGLPDLAASSSDGVRILLNNGRANFGSNYYIGNNPREVAAADFNGDGWTDLATANNSPGILSVLLNRGDGTFSGGTVYPGENGSYNAFLAAEDFNGDGSPDVAIARERDDKVVILLNRGDGTFLPSTHYHFYAFISAMTVGDFNGDGLPDVAALNQVSNTLSVLLNNGDGTLAPMVTYTCDDAFYLEAADLNGDGMADLVLADSDYSAVSVMLSSGDGVFSSTVRYAVGVVAPLVLADVNNDRAPDIVVGHSVLLNQGNGSFAPETVYNWNTTPLAAADLDGDGNIDLIGATYYTLGVWPNVGNGVFGARIDFTTDGTNAPVNVATGDFDGDGLLDVAKDNWGTGCVLVMFNRTDFPPTVVSSSVNGGEPQRARIERLSFTFSEGVSVAGGSLALHNDTTGADIDLSAAVYTYDAAARTGTWAFSGVTIGDGNYTATLHGVGVKDSISNTLAGGDYRMQFFRLSCDANGDRKVDDADLAILQQHWDPLGLNPGNCAAWGDFDGDGRIGNDDETLWQQHYNSIGIAGPPARPDLVDADDSGISHEDNLTNVATPRINIVSSVPGHTIRIYSGGVYLGNATPVSGATFQYAFAQGQLAEGANAITARAFDGTRESTDSPALTITLDTTAPASPLAPDLPVWADSGPFRTDNITDDVTPSFITASGVSYLRIYRDGTLAGGEYDRSAVRLPTQAYGTYVFTARAVDDAGNLSASSSPLTVTIWPTPPTPLTPQLTPESDTGASNSDNVTNCTAWVVWVNVLNFGITHVDVLWDGQFAGTVVYVEGSTWRCYAPTQYVPEGMHSVKVRAYEGSVPSYESPVYTFTVVTQYSGSSSKPTLDLADASDTGKSSSDNVTFDRTPTFNVGGGATYATVTCDGVQVSGVGATPGVTTWTLAPGTHSFVAHSADSAGNLGPASDALTVTILAPGDATEDRKVDGGDLAAWQQNYDPLGAHQNTPNTGDWNGDGKVDGGDLALWQQNYNPLGLNSVPEPQPLKTEQAAADTPPAAAPAGGESATPEVLAATEVPGVPEASPAVVSTAKEALAAPAAGAAEPQSMVCLEDELADAAASFSTPNSVSSSDPCVPWVLSGPTPAIRLSAVGAGTDSFADAGYAGQSLLAAGAHESSPRGNSAAGYEGEDVFGLLELLSPLTA